MKLLGLAVAAALAAPLSALATTGYFQHGYGMKAKGMGGVGIALPQDALAPATNPAGIGFLGDRADVGLDWFRPIRGSEIVGNGAGLNGSFDGSGNKNYYIPEFGLTRAVDRNLTFGLAVYGNGGMNTTYKTSPFAPFGDSSPAGVDLIQMFIAPTLAYKPSPNHSFGVSLNIAYQRFAMDGAAPFAGFSATPAKFTSMGDDDALGWGVRVGWTGKLTPNVTVGATYQSKTKMKPFNKYEGLYAERGDFDIPENFGIGIAVKATPQLTIAGDIQQINYGKVKSIGNPVDLLFAGNLFGTQNGPGFGWQDRTVYKLGVSYEWSRDLTLRAGFATLKQPIPASQTFLNIFAPGVVQDHITLGGTWAFGGNKELTLGYMHALKKNVRGSNSLPLAFGGGEANLRMYQNSLGIGFGWKM